MKRQAKAATHPVYGAVLVMYEYPAHQTALVEYGPHVERGNAVYARWATVPMKELTYQYQEDVE